MREYLTKRKFYLARILRSEAPPDDNRTCSVCDLTADWRCEDCYARPLFCRSCCCKAHSSMPFHHVERWVGGHYTRSALIHTGLLLHFGHQGKPCPHRTDLDDTPVFPQPSFGLPDPPPDLLDEEDINPGAIPLSEMELDDDGSLLDSEIPDMTKYGSNVLVIVHSNGVHHLPVRWCRCPSHIPDDVQALDLDFFPASFKQVRTLFTFQGLEAFLAENQECKTSAWHYYQKLRRLTSSCYPHTVPVWPFS